MSSREKLPDQTGLPEPVSFATDVWLELQKQVMVTSPKKVEEGAKQIITLSTFLSGAYFAAVSFAKLGAIENIFLRCLFVAPILMWVIAIGFAIPSIVPLRGHAITIGDPLSSKLFFVHFVQNNLKCLRRALLFQLLGIISMLLILWIVLSGIVALESEPMRLSIFYTAGRQFIIS
jgi:hypothetical protein